MSVAVSYQLLTRDIDRTLETTANRASVKLESEYYLAHIADVASLDDFLADARNCRWPYGLHQRDGIFRFCRGPQYTEAAVSQSKSHPAL